MILKKHDTYVAGLLKLLDVTNGINQPPFASSITVELRKSLDPSASGDQQYFVKLFYKNNSLDEDIYMREMTMNGCQKLCPLSTFMELTEKWAVTDFVKECHNSDSGRNF